MRILGLVSGAYGENGGIAQSTRDLIAALAAITDVASIDLLPRNASTDDLVTPPKVRQRPARPGRIAYSVHALQAARTSVDIVLCNHLFMSPLASVAAKLAKAKLVIQLHGIEIWPIVTRARRYALESADLVICVSRDTRERALRQVNIAPEKAIVINNTLGEKFSVHDRSAARARLGATDSYTMLTVGRVASNERYKGHDRVIEALPTLVGRCPRLRYLIAGEGDDRDRLERIAADRGVADRVKFLGHVSAERLPDIYRAADLFVLPSTGEGFGIVFLEAMACGTPAIGLAVGGARDALGDGDLAWCVQDEAFGTALAQAIEATAPHPQILSQRVNERFGRVAFNSRVALAFRLLVSDEKPTSDCVRPTIR